MISLVVVERKRYDPRTYSDCALQRPPPNSCYTIWVGGDTARFCKITDEAPWNVQKNQISARNTYIEEETTCQQLRDGDQAEKKPPCSEWPHLWKSTFEEPSMMYDDAEKSCNSAPDDTSSLGPQHTKSKCCSESCAAYELSCHKRPREEN